MSRSDQPSAGERVATNGVGLRARALWVTLGLAIVIGMPAAHPHRLSFQLSPGGTVVRMQVSGIAFRCALSATRRTVSFDIAAS